MTVPVLSQSTFACWNVGNGSELVREWNILCPFLLICQEQTFCATIVTTVSWCSHLSTAHSPLVYWALNLACYLWQIYGYIHYSSNSFRQKLRGAQRQWIIQNNYTIKKAVSEHCDSAQKLNERYREEQWWCGLLLFFFFFFFSLNQDVLFSDKRKREKD